MKYRFKIKYANYFYLDVYASNKEDAFANAEAEAEGLLDDLNTIPWEGAEVIVQDLGE
jgi:hypothetical protein